MTSGIFRNGHPRITLAMPTPTGQIRIEFIVDTGFDGDLALPGYLARQLDGLSFGATERALANGEIISCEVYEVIMEDEDGDPRRVEVLELEGDPLAGTRFFLNFLLQMEMTQRGAVEATPL